MSIDNVNAVAGGAQPAAKRNRRGVSNATKAVTQLRFHEKDAAPNGLFVGHLESVEVKWAVNAEGRAFTGENVPRIVFRFESNHINPQERRYVAKTLNCIESNVDTMAGGKEEWKVNNLLSWLKHILDVYYLKGRAFTPEEESVLELPFEDSDDEGNFIALELSEVINGYATLFNNVAALLNGNFNLAEGEIAKPVYKTADGKFIPVWMKLLRYKKVRNEWREVGNNGELDFDPFIGSGVLELVKKDCPPAILRVDVAKESITPKEVKKQPTLGSPVGMMHPEGGVVPELPSGFGSPMSGAFADAGSDMPF